MSKRSVLENVKSLFKAGQDILNSFKSNVCISNRNFSTWSNAWCNNWINGILYTKTSKSTECVISKDKLSPLKLNEDFANEIRNDEENINNKIFRGYFGVSASTILRKKKYLKSIRLKILKYKSSYLLNKWIKICCYQKR